MKFVIVWGGNSKLKGGNSPLKALKKTLPVSKLRENKALILNEIIKAFLSVPFQNILLLCEPEAERHVYTYLGRQCD